MKALGQHTPLHGEIGTVSLTPAFLHTVLQMVSQIHFQFSLNQQHQEPKKEHFHPATVNFDLILTFKLDLDKTCQIFWSRVTLFKVTVWTHKHQTDCSTWTSKLCCKWSLKTDVKNCTNWTIQITNFMWNDNAIQCEALKNHRILYKIHNCTGTG